MGFAGFCGELGLPDNQFLSGLIGFNVGVEIGQLGIVAVAWILIRGWRQLNPEKFSQHYRRWVVQPASLLIGVTGIWWTVERLLSM